MTLRDGTTCRMMSRVNDDESSSGAFVWCLPLLWLAGSVLIQLAMAPFASSSASGSAAILTFTLLMLMSLIGHLLYGLVTGLAYALQTDRAR